MYFRVKNCTLFEHCVVGGAIIENVQNALIYTVYHPSIHAFLMFVAEAFIHPISSSFLSDCKVKIGAASYQ
jgi:hypothetical protein